MKIIPRIDYMRDWVNERERQRQGKMRRELNRQERGKQSRKTSAPEKVLIKKQSKNITNL